MCSVGEVLNDVAAVFAHTIDIFSSPDSDVPAEMRAELWQQHLQLPGWQLQLERQLVLLVPFVVLHGAARLPVGSAACLRWMMFAAGMASQALPWWVDYTQALPPVLGDPWLQGQLPAQWVEDMLQSLLKLGGKAIDVFPAPAAAPGAAAQSGSQPLSAAGSSSSSNARAESSEHNELMMITLEGTVVTLGQILALGMA